MATLTTLRSNVAGMIGSLDLTDSTDLARIDGWVNEAYQDVLLKTGCSVTSDNTLLSAGVEDYTISQAILKMIGMTLSSGGTDYELDRYTPNEILSMRRNSTEQTTPYAFAATANLLLLYPTPSSSEDSILLYYVPLPAPLVNGSDTPVLVPPEWHKLVEWYACWRAADYDDDASSQQGDRYRGMYLAGINDYRRVIRQQGGSRPAPARLRRRRSPVSSDPSRSWH